MAGKIDMSRLVDAFEAATSSSNRGAWGDLQSMVSSYTHPPSRPPPPPPQDALPEQHHQPAARLTRRQEQRPASAHSSPARASAHPVADGPTIYERSKLWAERNSDAVRRMRQAAEARETEDCTFQPVLSRGGPAAGSAEPVEERLAMRARMTEERRRQRKEERRRQEDAQLTFRPAVNSSGMMDTSRVSSRATPYLDDDCFERLYRSGASRRQVGDAAEPRDCVIYDSHRRQSRRRSRPPSRDASVSADPDTVELTDEELLLAEEEKADLNELLRSCDIDCGSSQPVADTTVVPWAGPLVDSNYISDDEEARQGRSTFIGFLLRQNEHEERRLANLEAAEVRASFPHQPQLGVKTKQLCASTVGSARRERDELVSERGVANQEDRVRRLCAEITTLRQDLVAIQRDCTVALRADGLSDAHAAAGPFLSALQQWRTREEEAITLPPGFGWVEARVVRVDVPAELRDIVKAPPHAADAAAEQLGELLASRRPRAPPQRSASGSSVEQHAGEYSQTLASWLRALGSARDGLAEIRSRSEKLRRALQSARRGGDRRTPKPQRSSSGPRRPPGLTATAKADARKVADMNLQRGDDVLVRRLPQGRWSKAVFDHLDYQGTWVIEEGRSKVCVKPYGDTDIFVKCVPPPKQPELLIPDTSRAAWPEKPSIYHPKQLDRYSRRVQEDREKRKEIAEEAKRAADELEVVSCTHRPRIHAAPDYVSRIAHSMGLLRGERRCLHASRTL
eukprot:TRINITY_DN19368_c0_g1_i1.p1 TRINITY_DN19368_c0_g1~~TRINITY_DN19368_c0_g1_i1.p1  ORF type:complete len:757 (+),score=194.73 TRINITY_DN19368_c0_g1_i1:56-2272(+)